MPDPKKQKGTQTVLWWIVWILMTIGTFFIAAAFWTPVISAHFGTVRETRNAVLWLAAVFGTWIVFLLPLIIFMYARVDKVYEDARINREKAAMRFRSVAVDRSRRLLPENLRSKLESVNEAIQGGHLVEITLKDGRRFPHVFVQGREEILGIYGEKEMPFAPEEIKELLPCDLSHLPAFQTTKWLRLDGAEPRE